MLLMLLLLIVALSQGRDRGPVRGIERRVAVEVGQEIAREGEEKTSENAIRKETIHAAEVASEGDRVQVRGIEDDGRWEAPRTMRRKRQKRTLIPINLICTTRRSSI